MKINQIIINETTTAGSVATVSSPLGKTQSRNASIYGDTKVGSLFKGKKTSKPYANSINEGKSEREQNALWAQITDYEKRAKATKNDTKKAHYEKMASDLRLKLKTRDEVKEAKLDEEDKIIAVGKGHKLKPGLLSKPENSMNPTDTVKLDVPLLIRLLEYAREDANTDMDLHDLAEKLVARGSRGKTLSMKDYEYVVDEMSPGGVVAGGGVGEGSTGWHPSSTVKNPNFNDELSGRRVSPPGRRLKTGKLSADERGAQERTKTLMKNTQKKGGLTGPQGQLPEGAKVDRMVKHITKSEKKLGHSKKEAENIAWATANKRGMLDNKNKKKAK